MVKITMVVNVTGKERKALKDYLGTIIEFGDEKPHTEKEWDALFEDFFSDTPEEFWEYFDENLEDVNITF